jgi:hypothetical protein
MVNQPLHKAKDVILRSWIKDTPQRQSYFEKGTKEKQTKFRSNSATYMYAPMLKCT